MEGYEQADWDRLLDDMAAGGMNSLVICIRWKTTGYRSHLPYLDQDPTHTIIASNNELLRYVIEEAHKRGIKVWLQTPLNVFCTKESGLPVPEGAPLKPNRWFFKYDLDSPLIEDRAIEMCEEIIDLFPQIDGLSVETEGGYIFYPHRIAHYDAWAATHDRLSHDQLYNPVCYDCRVYPYEHWRAYATWRTARVLDHVKSAVRAKGFKGELSHIVESWRNSGTFQYALDLDVYRQKAPEWIVVPYEGHYDRTERRLTSADNCMTYPKELGLTCYYLGRGVMTWGKELSIPLHDHWRRDMEDALQYNVDGLWMFEADVHRDGAHVTRAGLQRYGFDNGRQARRHLLDLGRELGVQEALSQR